MVFIVKIIKVLGEGGFSFVYLAQDEHSGVRRAQRLRLSLYVDAVLNPGVEAIRSQEDSLSYGCGWCEGGYERG